MNTRHLGKNGPRVSALGLGCMGLSDLYGPVDGAVARATLAAAVEAGITLYDTGDFYGMGDNELLLAKGLSGTARDRMILSVKFGALRGPDGAWLGMDLRPAAIRNALAYSLKRLQVDHIDLYRPARLDPAVPIEDVVGTLGDLVKAGYIRHIGLSEVGAETLRRAAAVHPIADLQIEYSLISRGIERDILPTARALGIGITAYGVLSRGLISGHWQAGRSLERDFRSLIPRFQGENLTANLALVDRLARLAADKGVTAAQLAIAWVLAQGPDIVPLIGARRPERLAEALGAVPLTLSAEDQQLLNRLIPVDSVAGTRYPEYQMAMLDSERASG